jgi:predicted RNA-binding protein YlqC (UPF0109 family)
MTADYRDLVEYLVKNIVDHPEAVVVDSHTRHRSESIEIRLDAGDVGRVIGKGGRNIEAIRALVKAAATKDHRRVNVEVISERGAPGEAGETSEAEEEPAAELVAEPVAASADGVEPQTDEPAADGAGEAEAAQE